MTVERQSAYVRGWPAPADSTNHVVIDAAPPASGELESRRVQIVTVILFCGALIAAFLGFSGFAGVATTPVKILFFLLVNATALSFVVGIARRPPQ